MNSDVNTGEPVPRAVQACHERLVWLIPWLDQQQNLEIRPIHTRRRPSS